MILEVKKSRLSNIVIPNILKLDNSLNERTVKIPSTQVPKPSKLVAYILDSENLSITNAIAGSINDIDDVIAAKNNNIKNAVAIILPKSIAPNAIGKVWKIRPGPAELGSKS